MNRKRSCRHAAEVALAGAAIQSSVAVQDFLPVAVQRNAYAIIFPYDWSEIAHEKQLVIRIWPAAKEANDAPLRIFAVHPLETRGIGIEFVQQRLTAIQLVEIANPPL